MGHPRKRRAVSGEAPPLSLATSESPEMKPARLSREFLADLEAVVPPLPSAAVSPGFLNDLAAAYETVLAADAQQSVSTDELTFIGRRLQEWRSETQQELARLVSQLPKDDPLLCPVSLFGTMDYGRLETAHTRALAWLLDPDKNKEHGFGNKLLKALLERVAGDRSLALDEACDVEFERAIDDHEATGRLDIFAEGNWIDPSGRRLPWAIVLEAKIDALEGENQLSRYEDSLDRRRADEEVFPIFLTPTARQSETARKDWTLLSFQDLVGIFRLAADDLQHAPGYHFLRFYLAGVLRDVCLWPIPFRKDCGDPYSVLAYLKLVLDR